jgi:hypothetical protein
MIMSAKKAKRVREQVVVYLDDRDRALLEQMAKETGLARTELFRRGLRRLAAETLAEGQPGSALAWLLANAVDDPYPPDVAERHDYYLYGGGYEKYKAKLNKPKKKRARPR